MCDSLKQNQFELQTIGVSIKAIEHGVDNRSLRTVAPSGILGLSLFCHNQSLLLWNQICQVASYYQYQWVYYVFTHFIYIYIYFNFHAVFHMQKGRQKQPSVNTLLPTFHQILEALRVELQSPKQRFGAKARAKK